MLPGLKNAELEKCSHCMAGKQTRVSFKKHPPSRKSELLELVHSDVCGPLKVYVLKTKDQVLEKFKQFQALVERQSGKKVKCILIWSPLLNSIFFCFQFGVPFMEQRF
ncbi:hypothetical protein CR513_48758, partial [Mucuna pruriens]